MNGAGTDDPGCVLAFDLGGTMLKAGLVDRAGATLLARHRPAGREQGRDAVVDALLACVDELAAAARERGVEPAAVGVVPPGIVDEASGQVIVVGGGLAEAGECLFGGLERALCDRLTFHLCPRLTGAALGDQAGRLGAALLAWRAAGEDAPAEAMP